MVLDVKALSWAARNNIDTAKLKAAHVPIYGKWYFPEIPPGVPLINLETGERQVFPELMLAGEVVWAPEAELRRANLLPEDFPHPAPEEPLPPDSETRALRTIAPEPLLAIARPTGVERPTTEIVPADAQVLVSDEPADLSRIHMPMASIAPFVLGLGFCIVFLGLITNVAIVVVGLVWMLAGAVGWIRIGLLEEAHASHAAAGEGEHTA
jgi:hypothetical protein